MRNIGLYSLLLLVLCLFQLAVVAQDTATSRATTTYYVTLEASETAIDTSDTNWQKIIEILQYAEKYKGVRYRRAGKNPKKGFDCSGFVSYLFRKYGVILPSSSASMAAKLRETVPLDSVRQGDLLFFKGSNKRSKRIGHVALVHSVSEQGIFMIHATHRKGIVIDNLQKTAYYRVRYVTAKRPEWNKT